MQKPLFHTQIRLGAEPILTRFQAYSEMIIVAKRFPNGKTSIHVQCRRNNIDKSSLQPIIEKSMRL